MRNEIISPTHLIKIKEQLGSRCISKSCDGFCVIMFLPIYAMYYMCSCARQFILNGRAFRYEISWKNKKIAFLCCVMALHAKTRVHNFRNSVNGLEHTLFWLKSEFEHFKIQTRADFDEMLCRTLTWSSCVLNMVQFWWLVMKIWSKVDFHNIALGWRHDDLELLKSVTILSYTNINHHCKFHDNGFIHSWNILRKN